MIVMTDADGGRRVVTSPSDLTAASECEFAFLRKLDERLGRGATVPEPPNPLRDRAARMGDAHETAVLERYRAEGRTIAEFARPDNVRPETLTALAAETIAAFRSGVDVVYQAVFFDGELLGYADFIVKQPDGRYRVQDTKLARSAKVTALLQLAAYADQLARHGIPIDDTVELILGTGEISQHRLIDVAPVFANRYARLRRIVAERLDDPADARVAWSDDRYVHDGRCPTCEAEVVAHDDLLLVARMRPSQRAVLLDHGIRTLSALAEAPDGAVPTDAMDAERFRQFRLQARLQRDAAALGDGGPPPFAFVDLDPVRAMPAADPGDLFFDFEGDPLYAEGEVGALTGEHSRDWGLDYLFGSIEADTGDFVPFWAHSFAEEREAFDAFCRYLGARLAAHPGMHVYHYAPYERTHLVTLAARHGIHEDFIDDLLRRHVLVDLYAVVRAALIVGTRSYSLKKIEALYGVHHDTEVATAGESIEVYWSFQAATDAGDAATAQALLDAIADYNRLDCDSTGQLRDWLIAEGARHGAIAGTLAPSAPDPDRAGDESAVVAPLRQLAGDAVETSTSLAAPARVARADRTPTQQLYAMAAAAVDYYRRERTTFWLDHFLRLTMSRDRLAAQRDVFTVDRAASRVLEDWTIDGPRQVRPRRRLLLVGEWSPGSSVVTADSARPFVYYDRPAPFTVPGADALARSYAAVSYVEVSDDMTRIVVDETRSPDDADWLELPSAIGPGFPIPTKNIESAIERWGAALITHAPALPTDAVVDVILRRPPRTVSGVAVDGDAATDADRIDRVVASILDLDRSYLAVQGPPGTGKTYLASHVIARLVAEHRLKIGVVAQSHKVIEHVLNGVVGAGLDRTLVGKVPKTSPVAFTVLEGSNPQPVFAAQREGTGYVIGGTVWDFANPNRFARDQLDLLVVDEAGQFALAPTIGAASAAKNLVLLGDPQQLPQVTQGQHPEPIDTSALGWVADSHDVLPASLGYFLPESRRMAPELAAAVSDLAYEGRLRSHPVAATRHLDGVEPGLTVQHVVATGNATSSPEEADAVVAIVSALIGRAWTDPSSGRVASPLTDRDFIVVTPYNAQAELVALRLAAAGFGGVPVGTVDRFQGQEAVVAIASLAASSPDEVPRGMGFLIMQNRLNVAVSRAQWAAYLLHSPLLTEYLPHRPAEVAELSGFIRLADHP